MWNRQNDTLEALRRWGLRPWRKRGSDKDVRYASVLKLGYDFHIEKVAHCSLLQRNNDIDS